MAASAGKISHVIFDLDGLLLDTESLYSECTQIVLDPFGITFTKSVKTKMMGTPKLEAAKILVDELNVPLKPEEFSCQLYNQLYEKFPHAKYMPGALELVQHLHQHGIPLALATGSDTKSYEIKISLKPELVSCFSHCICSDNPEVKKGKPNPDIFLVTATHFPDPPIDMSKVLVFEDAPNGVIGAKEAGMNVVMVPPEYIDKEFTKSADRVVKTLFDVNLQEWDLPQYRK